MKPKNSNKSRQMIKQKMVIAMAIITSILLIVTLITPAFAETSQSTVTLETVLKILDNKLKLPEDKSIKPHKNIPKQYTKYIPYLEQTYNIDLATLNKQVTKEEFISLAVALNGMDTFEDKLKGIEDRANISSNYETQISYALDKGLVTPIKNNINPKANIKPSEIQSILGKISHKPTKVATGDLSKVDAKNIIIPKDTSEKSIEISEVVTDNLQITSKNKGEIQIRGNSKVKNLNIINNQSGDYTVRVFHPAIVENMNITNSEGISTVGKINNIKVYNSSSKILSDAEEVIISGRNSRVEIPKEGKVSKVKFLSSIDGMLTSESSHSSVTNLGTDSVFKLEKGGSVQNLNSETNNFAVHLHKSRISTANIQGPNSYIKGEGEVGKVEIKGSNSYVETTPIKYEEDEKKNTTDGTGTSNSLWDIVQKPDTKPKPTEPKPPIVVPPTNPESPKPKSISIKTLPTRGVSYEYGDVVDIKGVELLIEMNTGGQQKLVKLEDFAKERIAVVPDVLTKQVKIDGTFEAIKFVHLANNSKAYLDLQIKDKPKATGIQITSLPTKTRYLAGDALDLKGTTVEVKLDNGKSETIVFDETNIDSPYEKYRIETFPRQGTILAPSTEDTGQEQTKNIRIAYRKDGMDIQQSFPITIENPDRVALLYILSYKHTYEPGETTFDFSNCKVKLVSNNSKSPDIILRYVPQLQEFCYDRYTDLNLYSKDDIYSTYDSSGRMTKGLKIYQEIGKSITQVKHGDIILPEGVNLGMASFKIHHSQDGANDVGSVGGLTIKW